MPGRFITIEGPDGAGKSTLAKGIAAAMEAEGHQVLITREPGDGPIGPSIRTILLEGGHLDPWTEVFLFLADRRQHCESVIRPALNAGTWVLCDRFADSTVVYQGYGRDLSVDLLRKLNKIATSGLEPGVTLLLDLPVEVGQARLADRNRLDNESIEFHERVRKGFLLEAIREPQRWRVLDATKSVDELVAEALVAISP